MKKRWILTLALLLCLVFTVPAMATPTVVLDGKQLNFSDTQPVIEDGRTLVPLRAIFEAMGAKVEWNQDTQTATAVKGNTTIVLKIGSTTPTINGNISTLDVPAKVVNGRTLAPLRFVGEAFGGTVGWDANTQTIKIFTVPTTTKEVKVHFIDVGQGDAIYIELPNNNDILIDAGDIAYGSTVVDYLQSRNVDDIELLIATHPHADHIGGMPEVFAAYDIKAVIDSGATHTTKTYERYLNAIKAEGSVYERANNQSWDFDSYKFEILGPIKKHTDFNDMSVIAKLITPSVKFIFTGDAEMEAEGAILHKNLDSSILKVGHHGSNTSTSTDFLNKVNPEVAIISVGTGNTYGHPHQETISKLNNAGVKIYWTDLNGNIVVTTDGKTYSISTQKTAQAPVIIPAPITPTPAPSTDTGKYVGSTESDKYHYSSCRYAESILPANQIWFTDKSEAKAAGYESCGACKP